MNRTNRARPLLPLLLLGLASCGETEEAPCAGLSWGMVQWGSAGDDVGVAVALDSACAVSVAGETSGVLGAEVDRGGGQDVFLARLGQDGRTEWLRQVGSPADEAVRDVAMTPEGETFVVGGADGALPGARANAGSDSFAMRHDASGARQWLAQWGTYDEELGLGAALNSRGQLLLVGSSNARGSWDATLEVLDVADGRRLSTTWYGTEDHDRGEGFSLDASGAVYLAGATMGGMEGTPAGSTDAYVMRLTPDLTQEWVRQSATRDIDAALRVAADGAGNVYVLAVSMSDLVDGAVENDGIQGSFLLKYDAQGHEQWRRRIGSREDFSRATGLVVEPEPSGALYVAGVTAGAMDGANHGGRDAFLAKYDAEGTALWARQWGTERDDEARDIALTPSGDVVVVGTTEGDLAALNAGGQDVFLARFTRDGAQGAAP